MSAELMWKDAHEQARLVRDGEVSALELVDAPIARLEGAPELNVLVHADFEAARAAAATRPTGKGPLVGVPFLLKDLGEPQAGVPERMGSRALRDHIATETALSVHRYQAAGLIICGPTNTPEFGNHCATEPSLFGPTLNPWDHQRSPGGSSGGSAAAVAAGLVAAASGGDGTGSIRMPASPERSRETRMRRHRRPPVRRRGRCRPTRARCGLSARQAGRSEGASTAASRRSPTGPRACWRTSVTASTRMPCCGRFATSGSQPGICTPCRIVRIPGVERPGADRRPGESGAVLSRTHPTPQLD